MTTTPMTGREHEAYLDLIRHFEKVLARAAAERHLRRDLVPASDGGVEAEWAQFERDAMRAEVDRLRQARGLGFADEEDLLRAERLAEGHVDYAAKFALHCANLVMH